jgi:dTDP-4-dehydrorhamnose 3,5-epimerase
VKFLSTSLHGLFEIAVETQVDDRGFFARTWDKSEMQAAGLITAFDYCSISFNKVSGTLRGMHLQTSPYEEVKIVRCTAGLIFDVVVDVRPQSPTYRHWFGVELSQENRKALYIPPGMAHGFLTLKDSSEVSYQIAGQYRPDHAQGFRWDDPAFGIRWPLKIAVINQRDRTYPLVN